MRPWEIVLSTLSRNPHFGISLISRRVPYDSTCLHTTSPAGEPSLTEDQCLPYPSLRGFLLQVCAPTTLKVRVKSFVFALCFKLVLSVHRIHVTPMLPTLASSRLGDSRPPRRAAILPLPRKGRSLSMSLFCILTEGVIKEYCYICRPLPVPKSCPDRGYISITYTYTLKTSLSFTRNCHRYA